MEQLLSLILVLPLEKFAAFLALKKFLENIHKKDITQSLLQHAAAEQKLPDAHLLELSVDPLMIELEQFNQQLISVWFAEKKGLEFGEDRRMDITVYLFKQRKDKDAAIKKEIEKKLYALVNLYTEMKHGSLANGLTSLLGAFVFAHRAVPEEDVVSEMVADVIKNSVDGFDEEQQCVLCARH
ncbi:MAG: hypothetical protein ABI597_09415 [Gammaproteobacteria bacterium]